MPSASATTSPAIFASTVHGIFEACAARAPHDIAVVCRHERLTYDQLNRRANRLAFFLRDAGVRPGELVGVHLERSLDMVVAVLAILKAGAAYVPLDPSYPERRLLYMLDDTNARLLLTHRSLRALSGAGSCRVHLEDFPELEDFPDCNPRPVNSPGDLAYVMYTSGSTGTPKGVQVPHRAIVRLLFGVDYTHFGADRVFLQLAPLSFDASTFELWGPLLHGGKCILYPDRLPTLEGLQQILFEHDVTTLWLTASLYNTIVDESPHLLSRVQELLIGGEALSARHVKRGLELLPKTQIINGYGPTECTTFACCYRIPRNIGALPQSIPIGKPIGRTEALILDPSLRPVEPGVTGELFLGGDGLAIGYLNAPEKTAELFLDVHVQGALRRLYRTGDLVRQRGDGEIQFLGRKDQQVKIRGFRIELAEVELAIAQLSDVRQCAAVCHEDATGNKRLAAYVVKEPGSLSGAEQLRAELQSMVPGYMIPSSVVFLAALPLTPNGKVDRAALEMRSEKGGKVLPAGPEPNLPTQRLLLDIWRELFDNASVTIEDDFFLIGGDSLMAVRLVAEVSRRTGRTLPLEVLLHARTVTQLAEVLDQRNWEPPCSHLVTLQGQGKCPPLFCVPGLGGHAFMFHELSQALGMDQPLFALQLVDSNLTRAANRSIAKIAASCVQEIRSVQTHGPFQLLGYSLGGTVVLEIAHQLRTAGEDVGFVGLLDSDGPGFPRQLPGAIRSWLHLREMMRMKRAERMEYLAERLRNLMRNARKRPPRLVEPQMAQQAGKVMRSLERTAFPLYRAWIAHTPQFYSGRVTIFRAAETPHHLGLDYTDPLMGWGRFAADVQACIVPGSHSDVHRLPHVTALAVRLRERLRPSIAIVGVGQDQNAAVEPVVLVESAS